VLFNITITMKTCPKCSLAYVVSEGFHKSSHRSDGYQTYCKKCMIHAVSKSKAKKAVRLTKLRQQIPLAPERLCSTCLYRDLGTRTTSPCFMCSRMRDKGADTRHVEYAPKWAQRPVSNGKEAPK
jgi:hypothetical protein